MPLRSAGTCAGCSPSICMADASSSERNARSATPTTMALMHATMLAAVNKFPQRAGCHHPDALQFRHPTRVGGEERHRRRVQAKEELADPEGPTA